MFLRKAGRRERSAVREDRGLMAGGLSVTGGGDHLRKLLAAGRQDAWSTTCERTQVSADFRPEEAAAGIHVV